MKCTCHPLPYPTLSHPPLHPQDLPYKIKNMEYGMPRKIKAYYSSIPTFQLRSKYVREFLICCDGG